MKRILVPLIILIFLIAATILVVLYGKGYRLTFNENEPLLAQKGILVVSSTPNGAEVLINGHLTTATDNTINLSPGTYDIKIQKDGYFPWKKSLKIQEEIVTKAEARLFPVAPKLESIASTPVQNPINDVSGTKIVFQISSESASRKNGIYILNMANNIIPVSIFNLQSSSIQIADDTSNLFSQARLTWSPDSTEILAEIPLNKEQSTYYLLTGNRFNDSPQDVTPILQSVYDSWNKQKLASLRRLNANIPSNLKGLISKNFNVISWSPDETKILYQASISARLPIMIKPRRPGNNTLIEERTLAKNQLYIYDTKEDINIHLPIKLPDPCLPSVALAKEGLPPQLPAPNEAAGEVGSFPCTPPLSWLPDSRHLIYINDKKIIIMDDDGSNNITLFAGPFFDTFAVPWPDSSRIVILTNLNNPDTSPTLYTIGLK